MILKHKFKRLVLGLLFLSILGSFNQMNYSLIESCEVITQTELISLWNMTYERDMQDTADSIIKLPLGGYVISGFTNTSGSGDYDSLVMKIASNGAYEWNRTIGLEEEDKGYQIANCQTGGFVLATTLSNTTASITNNDVHVTRMTNTGNLIWNYTGSGPGQDHSSSWVSDLARSVIECSNGDILIGGVTQENGDCMYYLVRLDSSGNKIWERTFTHWDIDRIFTAHSVVECQDGGIAILGYTYNSTFTNDVWLVRTNHLGIELWNQTYGDDLGYQRPEGLVECADGGFAIVANTHTFGAGNSDGWVIRTDNFGNQLWNKTYGGTEAEGLSYIMEMPDGGFTLTGSTHSFDIGNGDAWLIRTDENGTILWNYTMGDEYGNSAVAFVYEGADTYTVVGNTKALGVNLDDIWVFKVKVLITTITPTTTPTETSNYPGIFFSVIGMTILITITSKRKKR